MENNFEVGIVWGVNGINVSIKMYNISSDFKYFYKGIEYEGIRVGGYLSITRGHIDIICQIESEEIKDNLSKIDNKNISKDVSNKERYERFVYAKCIGYFQNEKFISGVIYMPIIYNTVKMLSENSIKTILTPQSTNDTEVSFIIGKDIKYGIELQLPWNRIFNTHIGIFGNTGSGKSNTLTNLYKTLFQNEKLNLKNSEFVFIDFNGEYIGEKVFSNNKKIYKLNTRSQEDTFSLKEENFWNEEVLGILFQATEKTQKPFLKNMISRRKKWIEKNKTTNINDNILNYIKNMFKRIFETSNPKQEMLELMKEVMEIADIKVNDNFSKVIWYSRYSCYALGDSYSNNPSGRQNIIERLDIENIVLQKQLDHFNELEIRVRLFLISGLLENHVQYDNINPLLTRIKSTSKSLKKIIKIVENDEEEKNNSESNIKVISLRNCNQEIKKLFPILLAREYFESHKVKIMKSVDKTFHLIIDEAHNILSHQSNRESEKWKDYRLELFEEIIKEGRKFGFFLTVSSQRPADISETIMSQFHNFFIHRLINDKDLRLIDNVISTLDSYSKQLIPTLPQGACILTGTAFEFPQIIQVEKIKNKQERPNSDDIDLAKLWQTKDNN